MRGFFRFYGWGMQMKLHMGIYAVAMLFIKCFVCIFMGEESIEVRTVLEMIILAMIFAIIESALFPTGIILAKSVLGFRSLMWVAICNLLFAGGAMVFHWFDNIPVWGSWVLLFILEIGLAAMWFGSHVVLRIQTAELNKSLRKYQNKA